MVNKSILLEELKSCKITQYCNCEWVNTVTLEHFLVFEPKCKSCNAFVSISAIYNMSDKLKKLFNFENTIDYIKYKLSGTYDLYNKDAIVLLRYILWIKPSICKLLNSDELQSIFKDVEQW